MKGLVLLVLVPCVAACAGEPKVIVMSPKEHTEAQRAEAQHTEAQRAEAQRAREDAEALKTLGGEKKVLAMLGTLGGEAGSVEDVISGSAVGVRGLDEALSGAGGVAVPPKPGRATALSTRVVNTSKVDARQIGRDLRKLERQVTYCYQRQLRHDSGLAGEVHVRISVNDLGRVEGTQVLGNSVHPAVGTCVQNVVARARLTLKVTRDKAPALVVVEQVWRFQP